MLGSGCGEVLFPPDSGGGSGGGSSSVDVAASSSSGTAPHCGGEQGTPCAENEWCDFDEHCGAGDQTGVCKPKPVGCDDDCPGVCGCDGNFYCNACIAEEAGVDTTSAACEPSYSAINMFTGAPRFAFLKADANRDICFRLVIGAFAGSASALDALPAGVVESAEVTDHADDCLPWPGGFPPPPLGASVAATGLTGNVAISLPPCTVSLVGSVSFAPGPEWVPEVEDLEIDNLEIQGGCP